MKIHVTEKHIKKGVGFNPWKCPTAKAIQEATGRKPTVTSEWYGFNNEELSLPKKVTKFIDNFDRGKKVKPFSFVLKDLQ